MSKPRWYKVINSPPDEEVDWLSPITSSYSLCATKSGKVVCWDVHRNACIAQWDPFERWELWKCRVEFEQRTVFFTMAKVLRKMYASLSLGCAIPPQLTVYLPAGITTTAICSSS